MTISKLNALIFNPPQILICIKEFSIAHRSPYTGPRQTGFRPKGTPRIPRDSKWIPICNVNPGFELRHFNFEITISKKFENNY